ncbi:MAG: hypothetical protein LBE67_14640 [Kocuria palustris]|jgi:hypothetical protein|nr:hypothetical protein [Kocuria palustris]
MNLFTNAASAAFWFFNIYCNRHYKGRRDEATKEQLTEKNKKFEFKKMFELPWMFWAVMGFSIFQTSAASVFSQNATELAEKRFNVDSIKAGWYSSLSQYAGTIFLEGVVIVVGHKLTLARFLPRSLLGRVH